MAAHAYRQTACTGHRGRVDVGVLFPNLHVDCQVRLVDIHRHVGEGLRQLAAHGLADLDGVQIKMLVRPLALHLKGSGGGKGGGKIGLGRLHDGLHRLLAGHGPGHGDDAEHLPGGGVGRLHVAAVRGGLHVNGALADIDLEAAAVFQPPSNVGDELILKEPAVQTLQDHLAQLQQQHFIVVHHGIFPPNV